MIWYMYTVIKNNSPMGKKTKEHTQPNIQIPKLPNNTKEKRQSVARISVNSIFTP